MTIGERAREIALDYDKFHLCKRKAYYTGVLDFYIVINMSYDKANHFTVTLHDYSGDEEIECFTETKETIVDAVETILNSIWKSWWYVD